MRIACLQFAPQVGDVDNNLNRADSVLNRANPEDLDLLVLPELAFTGYNFKSLRQISPFLEPSGSGITSLWARTTALKYNCTVAVGYPEKVDVSANWPTSPEYYNSLLVINPDGETIANYRKTHLYYTDETWALEGHGFYRGFFPGLGHTTMGICMDLNPYRFEAPWHSFEFAFHILEMNANLVILSMAWNTREDAPMFTRMPKEPDMETLTYWIRRLEPLIRAEDDHEVIVVFCNRAGIEGDAVYAGTSAVIGIKKGEVNVYGILGRGDKDLLVVDTDNPAFAQLVYRPPAESEPQQDTNHHSDSGPPIESHDKNPKSSHGFGKSSPKEHSTSKSNSPKENGQPASRTERPRITIPDTQAPVGKDSVPTPSGPSPTPVGIRPKLEIPSNGTNPPAPSVLTPHPTTANPARERGHIYGGEVEVNDLFTPYTPFPSDHISQSPRYFWVPPDNAAKNPGDALDGHDSANPPTLEWRNSLTSAHSGSNLDYANGSHGNAHRKPTPVPQQSKTTQPSLPIQKEPPAWRSPSRNGESNSPPKHSQVGRHSVPPDRPTSPKSRNSSRSRVLERSNSSLAQRTDLAGVAQKLDSLALRSESAVGQRHRMPEESGYNPEGPKSRNASRSREMQSDNPAYDQRATNVSRSSILIAASPSILDSDIRRPVTIGYQGNEASRRRSSRAGRYGRHDSLPNSVPDQRLDSSMGTQSYERPPSRTTGRRQTPVPTDRTDSRAISRGRQPGSKLHPRERSSSAHSTRPEPPTSRENSRERRLLTRFDPNEIVAIEGHVTPGCPVHDGNNPPLLEHYIQSRPSASTSQNRSTSNNGRNRSNHGRNRSNQGRNYSAQGRNDSNQSRLPSTSRTRDSPRNQANHLRQESNHRPSPVSASVRNPGTPSRNPGGSLTRVKPIPDTSQTSNSAIANFIKSTSDNPTFRGISDEMLIASGDSPATPEQEPLTPKAMILIPDDDDDIISPMSAKTGGCGVNGKIKAFKCLDNDLGIGTNRPKSAVW